jgi:magnesium transporter
MARSDKHKRKPSKGSGVKSGMAPGTMVFIGEQKRDKVRLDVVDFTEHNFSEGLDVSIEKCQSYVNSPSVTWINVNGIHDIQLIEKLGKSFDLHPLTLEDIVNTSQRLKTEEFSHYIFTVLKMLKFNDTTNNVDIEHVSIILGKNMVISFLENESEVFNSIKDRIKTSKGKIRSMKTDYLAFALMDTVVDNYFVAIEHIGDHLEQVDDQILDNPAPQDLKTIHQLKRDLLGLRKVVWPLREELGALAKSDSPLMHQETKVFWRDLYDHTIKVIDMVETFRDILGSMQDTYLSSMSNRMNEVMKVLTIISTIFIPLTFIVGVYGMNFEVMPELKWTWGYALVWAVMLGIGSGLLLFFKRKNWL